MPAPDNQRFDAIDRPRVSLAIERTLAGFPVAAFIAPGGFGKTIAIAHVLARRDRPYVRFALDRRHADVAGFARGLAGALSGAEPSVIGDLTTPAPVEPLDVLERFLERTDCSILLDDFAVAPVQRSVQGAAVDDVLSALTNLGYQRPAAEKAIEQAVAKDAALAGDFDGLFRGALKLIR